MIRLAFHFLLLLCVTLWSCAPAVSFVYQMKAGGGAMIEICSADGFRTVFVPGEDVPSDQSQKKPSCPFCGVVGSSGVAMFSGSQKIEIPRPGVGLRDNLPLYAPVFSRSFQKGLHAPLRAPPVVS